MQSSDRQLLEDKLRTSYHINTSLAREDNRLNLKLKRGIYLTINPDPECEELEQHLYNYIDHYRSENIDETEYGMALSLRTHLAREIVLFYHDKIVNNI